MIATVAAYRTRFLSHHVAGRILIVTTNEPMPTPSSTAVTTTWEIAARIDGQGGRLNEAMTGKVHVHDEPLLNVLAAGVRRPVLDALAVMCISWDSLS